MREGNSVFNKIKNFVKDTKGVLFTVIILGVVIYFFFAAVGGASEKADASSANTLEMAIRKAAVQCYAVEGFYPPNVDYLVENYGIIINEEVRQRFRINYACFSSNHTPVIKVIY